MLDRAPRQPAPKDRARPPVPFLVQTSPAARANTGQRRRRSILVISFVFLVALPSLAAAAYYGLLASDQYAAEARFSIRGATSANVPEIMGILGAGSTSTVNDAYILIDFVRSRQILDKIAPTVDYRAIYSTKSADLLARLDPTLPMDEIVEYWRHMVSIGFDTTSQIVTLKVRAFTPNDTLAVTQAILKESEQLINDLSERVRSDAVRAAEQEVSRMEQRLRTARSALQSFRETRQELDPRKKAEARQQIVETLQGELTAAQTKLAGLRRQQLAENAPSVIYLLGVIAAIEKQIEDERNRMVSEGDGKRSAEGSIGSLIADYEALSVDREFAEKAYLSALSSLERARFDALRQQRYVATVVSPALPDDAQYPKRIQNTLIVLVLSFCLWALVCLIGLAVRDHVT